MPEVKNELAGSALNFPLHNPWGSIEPSQKMTPLRFRPLRPRASALRASPVLAPLFSDIRAKILATALHVYVHTHVYLFIMYIICIIIIIVVVIIIVRPLEGRLYVLSLCFWPFVLFLTGLLHIRSQSPAPASPKYSSCWTLC